MQAAKDMLTLAGKAASLADCVEQYDDAQLILSRDDLDPETHPEWERHLAMCWDNVRAAQKAFDDAYHRIDKNMTDLYDHHAAAYGKLTVVSNNQGVS